MCMFMCSWFALFNIFVKLYVSWSIERFDVQMVNVNAKLRIAGRLGIESIISDAQISGVNSSDTQ